MKIKLTRAEKRIVEALKDGAHLERYETSYHMQKFDSMAPLGCRVLFSVRAQTLQNLRMKGVLTHGLKLVEEKADG